MPAHHPSFACLIVILPTLIWAGEPVTSPQPASRTFLFTYAGSVTSVPPGKAVSVWLPVPPANEDQEVKTQSSALPAKDKVEREKKYGNEVLFFRSKPDAQGTVSFSVTYRVTRREVRSELERTSDDSDQLSPFLKPDALVPIAGKPLDLLKGKAVPRDQMLAARLFYDLVNNHMRYSKDGEGWGRGDAAWACASGYGNCSDFHSLFISLARAHKIPAKFEIGFPLPADHGHGDIAGYHCWAKFRPTGKGWIPVDISEANKNPAKRDYYFGNLTADRVTFSSGRDLELVPRQAGEPLNFFVYPYVEVDGKPYPAEKIQRKFSFKDLVPNAK